MFFSGLHLFYFKLSHFRFLRLPSFSPHQSSSFRYYIFTWILPKLSHGIISFLKRRYIILWFEVPGQTSKHNITANAYVLQDWEYSALWICFISLIEKKYHKITVERFISAYVITRISLLMGKILLSSDCYEQSNLSGHVISMRNR